MRTGPALVVALLVGALTGVALATAVSGTPAEARRAAAALVPATATVIGRSEERVTPWFGGQYVVVLTAEPLSLDQLDERVDASGAEVRERVRDRGATTLLLTRGRVDLAVSLIPTGRARIQAVPDEPSLLRAAATGGALSALAVGSWRRLRRSRAASKAL